MSWKFVSQSNAFTKSDRIVRFATLEVGKYAAIRKIGKIASKSLAGKVLRHGKIVGFGLKMKVAREKTIVMELRFFLQFINKI